MELLLSAGILGAGYFMSTNPKEKEDKKKFFAKVPLNKKPNGDNVYQSNRSYDIFESEWKNSGPLYKESFNTKESNVVFGGPPNYPNFLNKVDYADKQLPVEFNSTMSYNEALLDVQDVKTSANSGVNHSKNNKSKPESGAWEGISLTGDPINPNTFTHNNAQVFFGGKVTQNVDEYATRGIFENFTGDVDSYQHKKEQNLFFEPQKNVTNVYGTSNLDGYMLDRYYVSNTRNNESVVSKVYVPPALNTPGNAGQPAVRGCFDGRDYAMPKTTNEIRVKTDPKISYYGRIISGAHVAKPGKVGTMYKNRPDTYYVNTPERYFTTTGAVEAPAARPCQVLKYTNRRTTELKTRVNNAAPVHGSKGIVRSKYKVSNKVSYESDNIRNATVEGKWSIMGMLGLDNSDTPHDYGKKSIRMRPNGRTASGSKTAILNVHSSISKGEARNGQNAKRTIKEVTEINNHNGNMQTSEQNRGFVKDPRDKARGTIKQTTETNDHMGQIYSQSHGQVYDPNEVAKTTTRETTETNEHMGQLDAQSRGQVYDPNEVAKTTTRQTTETNEHMGQLRTNERGIVYDPEEYRMRTTGKEIHEKNKSNGYIGNTQQRAYTSTGEALRKTTKESTIMEDVVGIASGMERNDGYLSKEVNAPTTHRQQTSIAYMTNANRNESGGYEVADVQVPGTNRMFSIEYTGNVGNTGDTTNPMSYNNAYNSTMRSVRDEQDIGYTPNAMAPSTTIDPRNIHSTTSKIGDIQNRYIQERGVNIDVITNSIPQMNQSNITQMGDRVPNEPLANRINPELLNAFKSNPYSLSLNSWA